jgi:hypothetical protein
VQVLVLLFIVFFCFVAVQTFKGIRITISIKGALCLPIKGANVYLKTYFFYQTYV